MKFKIIISGLLVSLVPVSAFASQAGVFTQPLPDTEKFSCKYCPDPEETTKSIEFGVAVNTESDAKYMEYNGQNGEHLIPNLNGRYNSQLEEGRYINFWVSNLGMASREINLNTGIYGNYQANINYDQITHYQLDNFVTPFAGLNSDTLSLRSSGAQTTDIRQERYRFNLLTKKVINSRWETIVDYKLENKQGLKPVGAAIGSSYINAMSTILPEPVDQVTQLIKLGLAYTSNKFQLEAGYKGSLFNNKNNQLLWENAFPGKPNTDIARLALSPDSQHHQLYALGALRAKSWLKFKGQLSVGRIAQDQAFVDYTANTNLTTTALPKSSLDGQVNTLAGNLRASVDLSKKISADANLYIDRKDNKTSQATYQYVTLDTATSNSKKRTNIPYGYRKYGADVSSSYRIDDAKNASVGYEYEQLSRSYSEVSRTKAHEYWAKYRQKFTRDFDMSVKFSYEQRNAEDYTPFTYSNASENQNPLMRKFNLADKNRNLIGTSLGYSGFENIAVDFYLDYAMDDYNKTEIGLTESKELAYGANLNAMLTETINFNVFISRENFQSIQLGASDSVNWKVESEDMFTTLGLGLQWPAIKDDLDVGGNYRFAMAKGDLSSMQTSTGSTEGLPSLKTNRHTLELFANYHYDEDLIIKVSYVFESYSESNWHFSDLEYNSVADLRGVSGEIFDYDEHFISTSIFYRF